MGRFEKLAIVIPAYNEEKSIHDVVSALSKLGQVFVVNDKSKDHTGIIAKNAGAIVINHEVNSGYEGSLRSGFLEVYKQGYEYFVTCDADGQHSYEAVEQVAEILINGQFDLVIGERAKRARLAEGVFAIYTNLKYGVKDPLSGLKGYSKKGFELQKFFSDYNSIGTQLALCILTNKSPYKTIPIHIEDRAHGEPRFGSLWSANTKIFKALFEHLQMKYPR